MGDWELVRGADREIDRFSARDDDLERRVHAFWVGGADCILVGQGGVKPGLNGFGSRWRVWRCTWRRRLMGRRIVIVIVIAAATATAIARWYEKNRLHEERAARL